MTYQHCTAFSGRGTELISLYIPSGKGPDALGLLRDELGKASNIKSRTTKNAVIAAIRSASEQVKALDSKVHSAVFVGDTSDGWISQAIEAPKPLKSIIYRCGSSFFLEPIDAMQEHGPVYALICLDLHDASLALLQGTHLDVIWQDESTVPSKQDRGGQSARRYEKNRQIAIKAWFKSSAEHINERLAEANLAGIVISGSGLSKNKFADGEFLHHELRKRILGVIDTGYSGEQGIRETLQNAGDLLAESELVKQRKLMSSFFQGLAKDGAVAYGPEVLEMLRAGRVKTLLLSKENGDISRMAEDTGAETCVISGEFEEGAQLEAVFGGMAAVLRY